MPTTKLYIHCVWGTKRRARVLKQIVLDKLLEHIKRNAKIKGIHIVEINGYMNHIHCLLSLEEEQPISKVMQLIKGESSFWMNKTKLTQYKFRWAEEYFAASVSPTDLVMIRKYIRNQPRHHSANM